MNDAVELSFFPISSRHPISQYDAGDAYESCVLKTICGGVTCPPGDQLKLAKFLDCFEGQYRGDQDAADGCAKAAGLDVATIDACYSSEDAHNAAMQMVHAADHHSSEAPCLPWVRLDGMALSNKTNPACLGKNASTYPLVDTLCTEALARGIDVEACERHVSV